MSTWSKEKTSSLNVNGGNEYNALDGVKSSDLNKCFNNSFYTVDTVDRMGDGGEYSSSQIYTYPNIVTYNGNGYMAIYKVYNEYASFSNIVPTNTTYWKKICSVGGIAEVVQVTGQDTTKVMSQKAVTDLRVSISNYEILTSSWASDTTYTDYPYRASIVNANVTSLMFPSVSFPNDGNKYSNICESFDGGIYVYATAIPSASVTLNALCVK